MKFVWSVARDVLCSIGAFSVSTFRQNAWRVPCARQLKLDGAASSDPQCCAVLVSLVDSLRKARYLVSSVLLRKRISVLCLRYIILRLVTPLPKGDYGCWYC